MRGRFFIILLFCFLVFTLIACKDQREAEPKAKIECPSPYIQVKVIKALDGDTVELERGERLRYAAINTPELHTESGKPEPFAKEAYLKNRELTEGKILCLEKASRERDQYGRLLGELYFPNGTSVSEILLSEGLAFLCYYEGSSKFYERLLPVLREAIEARKGLFSYLNKAEAQQIFIGNKKTKRFHASSCEEVKKIKRKVVFKNLEEALREGYCPSRECMSLIFKP